MRASIVRSTVMFAAGALTLSGCYQYRPIPIDLAPQGENVEVVVTRTGAFELGEVTNLSGEVPVIRGEYMGEEDDALLLQVPVGSRQDGIHRVDLQQIIRVPTGEVLAMSQREFDAGSTALVVGVGAAGVAALLYGIIEAFGSGSGSDGTDPPDDSWMPLKLFSIPIG